MGGCSILELYHNPLTKKLAHMMTTQYMTGSAVLDKTALLKYNSNIQLLDVDKYFNGNYNIGGISTHHQSNSWVSVPKNIPEIIVIVVSLILIISVSIIVLSSFLYRTHRKCKIN